VQQRPPRLLADAQGRGHLGDDEIALPEITQVDETTAVSERGRLGMRDPQRQPGLSDAARPAQGKRPGHAQQFTQLREFRFAAPEAVWFLGQMSPDLVYLVTVQPASPPCQATKHSGADRVCVHVQPGETRITTPRYIWGPDTGPLPGHFAAIEYIATYIVLPMPGPAVASNLLTSARLPAVSGGGAGGPGGPGGGLAAWIPPPTARPVASR